MESNPCSTQTEVVAAAGPTDAVRTRSLDWLNWLTKQR